MARGLPQPLQHQLVTIITMGSERLAAVRLATYSEGWRSKLLAWGVIKEKQSQEDGGETQVELTGKGRQMLAACLSMGLPETEAQKLRRLRLADIAHAVGTYIPPRVIQRRPNPDPYGWFDRQH